VGLGNYFDKPGDVGVCSVTFESAKFVGIPNICVGIEMSLFGVAKKRKKLSYGAFERWI
jgi:hypothetical protein